MSQDFLQKIVVANILWFWWDSSATVLNHFHAMYQSICSIEHLFFNFPSNFFICELDFWALHNLEFSIIEKFYFQFIKCTILFSRVSKMCYHLFFGKT